MRKTWKRLFYVLAALAVAALLALALRPEPLAVETAAVQSGSIQVTVDEDGETRARDRYVIAAPVAGRVARIDLRDGDAVSSGQVVAELRPLPLSAREREEQLARIAGAEATLREADARAHLAQADNVQKRRERARADNLVKQKFVSPQVAEQAWVAESSAANELHAAQARLRAAEADLRAARAALLAIDSGRSGAAVELRSPVAGRVLRIPERSERVVRAGEVLATVGDPTALEVVADVLSQDAVRIRPGMPVLIEGWGGDKTLQGRVRLVEAFAFTKVSALGVEEQRVNVVADIVDAPAELGDAYRVEARFVVASAERTLTLPVSALFRDGARLSVFVVEENAARLRPVDVGLRNAREAEVRSGLKAGEVVVRHPANTLDDGGRVRVMPEAADRGLR
jgi:HlyD family secretion protein